MEDLDINVCSNENLNIDSVLGLKRASLKNLQITADLLKLLSQPGDKSKLESLILQSPLNISPVSVQDIISLLKKVKLFSMKCYGFQEFKRFFALNKTMKIKEKLFNLREVLFENVDLSKFPLGIFEIAGLKKLGLRHTNLTNQQVNWIFKEVTKMEETEKCLQYLDLSGNKLNKVSPISITSMNRIETVIL